MIRTTVAGVVFLGVCAALGLTSLAGDAADRADPIKLLLSEDTKVRAEGQRRILMQTKTTVSQLAAIIDDPENHVHNSGAVQDAMRTLGALHATEGIDILIAYIGFPLVHHPKAPEYPQSVDGGTFGKPIEQLFPAVGALIEIGDPCVPRVIKKLGETKSVLEERACIAVLRRLSARPSVREQLLKAIKRAPPERRENLSKALAGLDETGQ